MKVLQRASRKALILSPVASHPQDFGNRRRVYQTCDFFRRHGYEIHFLLYPMEPDWMARMQSAARDMRREWESFQVIPSSRPLPLQSTAVGDYHEIDEWWDPTIGLHLRWLLDREHFDVFVVNYVFISKALEYAGPRTVKVLETHDRFSGRKELLTALGARIESFYTTEESEKVALDRADIVVAIKESEADFYRALTTRRVITVPFWLDQKPLEQDSPQTRCRSPLRAGFIGALNVVNVANAAAFLREFESNPEIAAAQIEFSVAGEVCHQISSAHPKVRLLGRVESLEEFYDSLDVIAVPMSLSTGLKIKTGEALSFGKAVVATADGFDGFPPADEFHALDSFRAICSALATLASNRARLRNLERRSRLSARLARRRMEAGYRCLATAISRHLPTILFLTDQPVFDEGNIQVERLAQWCQLCADIATTIIGYAGDLAPTRCRTELADIEIVSLGGEDARETTAAAALDGITSRYRVCEAIVSAEGTCGSVLLQEATRKFGHVTVDTWWPRLAISAGKRSIETAPDEWPPLDDSWVIPVRSSISLRYVPNWIDGLKRMRSEGALIVLCGPDDQDRIGVSRIVAAMPGFSRLGTISLTHAPGGVFERDFLDRLRECARPSLILAVGRDARAHALCDGLATVFGAACFHIASVAFPILVVTRDGTCKICSSYNDFVSTAAAPPLFADLSATNRLDTGWARYKQKLISRLLKANAC